MLIDDWFLDVLSSLIFIDAGISSSLKEIA